MLLEGEEGEGEEERRGGREKERKGEEGGVRGREKGWKGEVTLFGQLHPDNAIHFGCNLLEENNKCICCEGEEEVERERRVEKMEGEGE